jgi:DNA-directed RNA polymerase subunit beta'
LPRIAELFEARIPKEIAEIARIDGVVEVDKMTRGKRQLLIRDPETGITEEHNNIPANKHLTVSKGDVVRKGQKLTEGSVVPHALLEVCGPHELQRYLVDEIQLVYRAQGVEINDKHIEIIIRQMMQKVKITDQGSSVFLTGEQVDRSEFILENKRVAARGGKPAEAEPVLLGITKASLETESFISAASFQDTTRILTDAATLGKVDKLLGFKENVITGHLIPAGTGTEKMQSIRLKYLGEEIEEELLVEKSDSEQEMPDYSSDVLDEVVEEKTVEEE